MQSAYSLFGSRVHLVLEDEVADAYNRAVDVFLESQRLHHEYHEVPWNGKTHSLRVAIDTEDAAAFNKIGSVINFLSKVNCLNINEDEITSDYLVKL